MFFRAKLRAKCIKIAKLGIKCAQNHPFNPHFYAQINRISKQSNKKRRVFSARWGLNREKKCILIPTAGAQPQKLSIQTKNLGINHPKKAGFNPQFGQKAAQTSNERPYKTFLRCKTTPRATSGTAQACRGGESERKPELFNTQNVARAVYKEDYPGRETRVVPCVCCGGARGAHTLCVCYLLFRSSTGYH